MRLTLASLEAVRILKTDPKVLSWVNLLENPVSRVPCQQLELDNVLTFGHSHDLEVIQREVEGGNKRLPVFVVITQKHV